MHTFFFQVGYKNTFNEGFDGFPGTCGYPFKGKYKLEFKKLV